MVIDLAAACSVQGVAALFETTRRRGHGGALASPTLRFAFGRLIPAALTIAATPVSARLLGADGYGVLAAALAASGAVSAVAFGWAEPLMVRELAGPTSREKRQDVLRKYGGIAAAVAILALLLTTIIAVAVDDILVFAVGTVSVFVGASWLITGVSRAEGRAAGFVVTATLAQGGRSVGGVGALALGAGILGYMWGWAAFVVCALFLGMRFAAFPALALVPALPTPAALRYIVPLSGVAVFVLLLQVVDRLVLAAFVPASELGVYSLGYTITEVGVSLSFAVLHARRFPVLLSLWGRPDRVSALEALQQNVFAAVAIPLATIPVLLVLAEDVLGLVGGPEFVAPSTSFMLFVAVGLAFYGVAQWVSVSLQHARRTRDWLLATGAAVVVNISVMVMTAGEIGIAAGGLATLLAYATMCVAVLVLSRDRDLVRVARTAVIGPLGALAVALAVTVATAAATSAVPAAVLGTVGYLCGLLVVAREQRRRASRSQR
jgi:PST family polysaccharide transporter